MAANRGTVAAMAALGFIVGAAAGLAWGQSTRSRLGESVKTSVRSGVLTVEVDALKAAAGGFAELIR